MNDELVGQILGALVNRNDGNGLGGSDGALWLIIILVLFGGWGGRGFGGYGNGNGTGAAGGDALYPWINQSEQISGGFRDQMINNGITGVAQSVTGGFADVLQALCAGFGGVNMNIANGFAQAEIAANGRQMANMQQQFAMQTATQQGFNAIQAQQAECCCENRLATANQTATLLAEHCADRNALNEVANTIVTNQNNGVQRIIDQLCQDKIDEKNDQIAMLRQQVQMQNLAASQAAQTAQILADNFAQTNALEQYLAPVPRPAYIVQNPNCCQQGFSCGCSGI